MSELKKGDRVVWSPGTSSSYHKWPEGGMGVLDHDPEVGYSARVVVLSGRGPDGKDIGGVHNFKFEDLTKLEWAIVVPGDKVTLRVKETDEEVTATATRGNYVFTGYARVLGVDVDSRIAEGDWELLAIERPIPPLPVAPGSRARHIDGTLYVRAFPAIPGQDAPWFPVDESKPLHWKDFPIQGEAIDAEDNNG